MSDEQGFKERVTRQGEEAIGKLAQELLENPVVSGALSAAFETRERAMRAQEVAMGALNLPSASDLERLTRRVRSVSQRLEGIEDGLDRLDDRLQRSSQTPTPTLDDRLTRIEDGNGRIGRAIAEKSLAQSLGQPTLVALATTILAQRKSYYEALEAASKRNEITNWLAWFAGITIEAQRRTLALTEFIIDKTKLLDRLSGQLNERQQKALLRVCQEGPQGFKGGLSASNYITITGASPATATRDLVDLIEKGTLIRVGEHRHARYHLNITLQPVKHVTISNHGQVTES